jgi:hypothetical protein
VRESGRRGQMGGLLRSRSREVGGSVVLCVEVELACFTSLAGRYLIACDC